MIQILVSACLTGENCKWDGGNNRNEALLDFMERMKGKAEFHPVCPEQMDAKKGRLAVRLAGAACILIGLVTRFVVS